MFDELLDIIEQKKGLIPLAVCRLAPKDVYPLRLIENPLADKPRKSHFNTTGFAAIELASPDFWPLRPNRFSIRL